jgi:hypothetical protein
MYLILYILIITQKEYPTRDYVVISTLEIQPQSMT